MRICGLLKLIVHFMAVDWKMQGNSTVAVGTVRISYVLFISRNLFYICQWQILLLLPYTCPLHMWISDCGTGRTEKKIIQNLWPCNHASLSSPLLVIEVLWGSTEDSIKSPFLSISSTVFVCLFVFLMFSPVNDLAWQLIWAVSGWSHLQMPPPR